jgi:hypothetical protein
VAETEVSQRSALRQHCSLMSDLIPADSS